MVVGAQEALVALHRSPLCSALSRREREADTRALAGLRLGVRIRLGVRGDYLL